MTAMGALSLKVDDRTRDRLRHVTGQDNSPDVHRRSSVQLAFNDISNNVRGIYYVNPKTVIFLNYIFTGLLEAHQHRRNARLGQGLPSVATQVQAQTLALYPLQDNGQFKCQTCNKDYASLVSARR